MTFSLFRIGGVSPAAVLCPTLDSGGNGTTTLNDLTNSGYDGTLVNMDAATDWVSDSGAGGVRALLTDGVNDGVYIPKIGANGIISGYSVSIWFKPDDVSAGIRCAINQTGNRVYIGNDGTSLYVRIGSGAPFSNSETVNTSNWFHVVVVLSASSFEVYFNGASIGSSAAIYSTPIYLGLGAIFTSPTTTGGQKFSGLIDDCRIYSDEISSNVVAELYASGEGRGVLASGASFDPFGGGLLV